MNYENDDHGTMGVSQDEGHKKKKKHRNKKKANPQSNGDASSQPVHEKDFGQVLESTEPLNVSASIESIPTAPGTSLSPADTGWHMDAGPSYTNGWDDPVEGWELQPAYVGSYGDNITNGKALVDDAASDAGWETVVKVRGKGSVERRESGLPHSGRGGRSWPSRNSGQERNSRHGGGSKGSSEGNGRKFSGRGGSVAPRGQNWGPNSRHHDTRQADRGPALGGLKASSWDSGNGQGPGVGPDGVWPSGGDSNYNGSDTSSRGGLGHKNWHQGARAPSERSAGSAGFNIQQCDNGKELYDYPASTYSDSQCSDLDQAEDDSDDAFLSDGSDALQSHEDQKKAKWFRDFFQDLESMSDGQINEHDRQWHCPACKHGPGAIDWFRGLGPLATHARTMRSRRVKLHRNFADVLEEELRLRRTGASSGGSQGAFGKWKGIHDENEVLAPQMIVWPPIIVIQNTQLEQDEQGKWLGMGNKELLDMFQDYKPMKPRHAYGPQGHRGMSLLIFADTPTGYHDACRLDKLFVSQRRGREDWHRPSKLLFRPGGNRILYGYMAVKEDLDIFNRHSKGKTMVKYEVRKLHEMVVEPMQRMDEKNHQMQSLQSKVEREQEVSKTLKKAVSVVSRNLQLREQELQVLRQRAEEQHARNKLQQSDLEEFYQQETAQLADEVSKKDAELQKLRDDFDRIHLDHRQQLETLRANIPNDQQALMDEEIAKEAEKVEGSLREAQDFEQKLRDLEQTHHEERLQFQKEQHKAAVAFEQKLKAERAEFLQSFEKQMRH